MNVRFGLETDIRPSGMTPKCRRAAAIYRTASDRWLSGQTGFPATSIGHGLCQSDVLTSPKLGTLDRNSRG